MVGAISRTAVRSLLRRIAPPPWARSFSAAAALPYESDWEQEGDEVLDRKSTARLATNAWGEMEGRGVQWVFMGSPGAKKHLYANRLAELLEVPYISMGTLVRQELDPTSSLYIKVGSSHFLLISFQFPSNYAFTAFLFLIFTADLDQIIALLAFFLAPLSNYEFRIFEWRSSAGDFTFIY